MVISTLAEQISRRVEAVGDTISESLFEPVIRVGVTGLARSGKSVFITSLVSNLLDRGRMSQLLAEREGRIETVYLQPQPDDTVARFEYETHLQAVLGEPPAWPQSTRAVSELRLSFRVRPNGLLAGVSGPRTVHLDIVDYPGEWLLDLGLLDKTYAQWSAQTLARLKERDMGRAFWDMVQATDTEAKIQEPIAGDLARCFTTYLKDARDAGHYDCTPGRFLLPGELAGSPVLTFAPLPPQDAPRRSLYGEMERRFEAYKTRVVKPFFRDHFARIDRQVVLVDALGAIHKGPAAVDDMRMAMADVLAAFRPGKNAFLSRLLIGKRVEKILFAATQSDHLHHSQHPRLAAFMEALLREARDRARFAGASTSAMAIASLRATTETTVSHDGRTLDCVRGTLLETGKEAAFYAGDLPEDPMRLLTTARDRAAHWLDQDYQIMRFAPARMRIKPGDGLPHIRMDRAAEFLIGDAL